MNTNLKFVIAFVTLILGLAVITVISDQANSVTSPILVQNESLSIASARLAANNINTTYVFYVTNKGLADAGGLLVNSITIAQANGSSLNSGNYTVDYTTYPDQITFKNTTLLVGTASNTTYLTYQYYQNSYLNSTFGRTTILIIPGFFALALMAVSLGLFYSVAKDYKIL